MTGPTTPQGVATRRFGLFPFRSPLLRESIFLSLPAGTEMFQFPTFASTHLCIQWEIHGHDPMWVSPFGHRRIIACSRLPDAFRSVPRPSSPPGAKASTVSPSKLVPGNPLTSCHPLDRRRPAARVIRRALVRLTTSSPVGFTLDLVLYCSCFFRIRGADNGALTGVRGTAATVAYPRVCLQMSKRNAQRSNPPHNRGRVRGVGSLKAEERGQTDARGGSTVTMRPKSSSSQLCRR